MFNISKKTHPQVFESNIEVVKKGEKIKINRLDAEKHKGNNCNIASKQKKGSNTPKKSIFLE